MGNMDKIFTLKNLLIAIYIIISLFIILSFLRDTKKINKDYQQGHAELNKSLNKADLNKTYFDKSSGIYQNKISKDEVIKYT